MRFSTATPFIELARNPVHGEHEVPSVAHDLDEPPALSAPVTDAPGESPKESATHG
jgi:hypothetical protein